MTISVTMYRLWCSIFDLVPDPECREVLLFSTPPHFQLTLSLIAVGDHGYGTRLLQSYLIVPFDWSVLSDWFVGDWLRHLSGHLSQSVLADCP